MLLSTCAAIFIISKIQFTNYQLLFLILIVINQQNSSFGNVIATNNGAISANSGGKSNQLVDDGILLNQTENGSKTFLMSTDYGRVQNQVSDSNSTNQGSAKDEDGAYSVGVLAIIIIFSIISIIICLHCCYCSTLYCIIFCREICLYRDMIKRQAKMQQTPFVILFHPAEETTIAKTTVSSISSTSASAAENPVVLNPKWRSDSKNEGYHRPQIAL